MMPLLLVRLGTADYADGQRTMYALLDGERVADVLPATNDDEALAKGRALASDGIVECEPALDAVAKRRGAAMRAITTFEKIAKAHLAAPLFEEETYRSVKDGFAYLDFFEAAYVFANAVKNDTRRQWNIGGHIKGTVVDTAVDRDVVLVVVPGPEPKLFIVSEQDARAVFGRGLDLLSVDHAAIEFRSDNPQLASLFQDAYGIATVPTVSIVERGTERRPENFDFEVLAPLMGIVGRYVVANVMRFVYTPLLGGELEVTLSTFEAGRS